MNVLFVIDMINGFCVNGNLASPSIREIAPNIINFYNENKDNIHTAIAFADCHNGESLEFEYMPEHCVDNEEQEIIPELLNNIDFETTIYKNSTNGFHEFLNIEDSNDFAGMSASAFWRTNTFYITGCLTSYCVMQFALSLKTWINEYGDLFNKNIKVVVLKDCCADVDKEMEEWAIKYMQLNGIEVR